MFAVATATLLAALASSTPARLWVFGALGLSAQSIRWLLSVIQIRVIFVLSPCILQHHLRLGLPVCPAHLSQHPSLRILKLTIRMLIILGALGRLGLDIYLLLEF